MEEDAHVTLQDPPQIETPPPPQGTLLLEVEQVFVHFGSFAAVRGATFSLRAGNLLGLIGPNGAGKTTLLRAIASLQATSGGTITMLGEKVVPGNEEAARLIGFTPDTPPLYDSLTVRQFLEFIAAGYGLTPENTGPAIDFWLEKVWLADKAKQKVRGLSRGMKQRLGIARTLLPNPTIILLDEPAAGLDPAGRAQFRKLLCDLRDQGKTLIVSSHFLADMEEYCTHIAIMSQGTIQQFGSIREIASGKNDGRCRYTVDLVEPVSDAMETIGAIEGVSHVEVERLKITLEFWSDRERAAGLLRMLVGKGLPLSGFAANAGGLEEAYLRTATRQVD
jgi:ABC-2 type transport system ATP-binding protein